MKESLWRYLSLSGKRLISLLQCVAVCCSALQYFPAKRAVSLTIETNCGACDVIKRDHVSVKENQILCNRDFVRVCACACVCVGMCVCVCVCVCVSHTHTRCLHTNAPKHTSKESETMWHDSSRRDMTNCYVTCPIAVIRPRRPIALCHDSLPSYKHTRAHLGGVPWLKRTGARFLSVLMCC